MWRLLDLQRHPEAARAWPSVRVTLAVFDVPSTASSVTVVLTLPGSSHSHSPPIKLAYDKDMGLWLSPDAIKLPFAAECSVLIKADSNSTNVGFVADAAFDFTTGLRRPTN